MTTTAQRLASLSGLPPGQSAKAHLLQIAGAVGSAGALLVMRSGLLTGTAMQHLLADAQVVQSKPLGGPDDEAEPDNRIHKQNITLLNLFATFVTSGALE